MNRFLLLALTAGLLSPIATHSCAFQTENVVVLTKSNYIPKKKLVNCQANVVGGRSVMKSIGEKNNVEVFCWD